LSVPAALSLSALLIASVSGCGGSEPASTPHDQWGPLAVIEGPPSGDEALNSGTLLITDTCVLLDRPDGGELLVWPSEGTTWDPDNETIHYSDGNRTVELSSGDSFQVGGGGSSASEDGLDGPEWVATIDAWAAEPATECLTDSRFFVGGLPPEE
jgi:hypothetical protein